MALFAKALAAAAAASLLLASPGLADKDKKPHPKDSTLSTVTATAQATGMGAVASPTAVCPKGMQAVSGGFNAPMSMTAIPIVFDSVRSSSRSWRSSAQVLGSGTMTLTTSVYCKRKLFAARTRRATASTDGSPHLGPLVAASCKGKQIAIAGGFTMTPPLSGGMVSALVLDSRRDGSAVWNTFLATGAGGASSATTQVYCARRMRELSEVVAPSPATVSDFETVTATARCGGGSPVSGGFSQPQSNVSSFLIVNESQRVGDGWKVSGLHSGTNPAVSLNAHAYC